MKNKNYWKKIEKKVENSLMAIHLQHLVQYQKDHGKL